MVSVKTLGLAVLQVAAVMAELKCYRGCKADNDALLQLLGAEPEAPSFCGQFLGIATSTVELTVTSTVIVSETATKTSTTITTDIDSSTITVPAPLSTFTAIKNKRDVPYPVWLPETYSGGRVSYACGCLSRLISTPVITSTETAEPVTSTDATTTTDTVTSTYHSTVIVTSTAQPLAPPAPSLVAKRARIEVLRTSNGAPMGWVFTNGVVVGITTNLDLAAVFSFSVLEGATSTSQGRLTFEAYSPAALGVMVGSNTKIRNSYGGLTFNTPMPPGSVPLPLPGSTSLVYETDIWTLDTNTQQVSWRWIESDGTVVNVPSQWRLGGAIYAVGNAALFNAAFASISTSLKYEISLKYVEI